MIEKWKKSLAEHGFKTDPEHRTSFIRRSAFLDLTIWEVRLRLMEGHSNIRLGIGYTDRFMKDPFKAIMLETNLVRTGPQKTDLPGTYWKQADEAVALRSLIELGIPWLEHYGDPKMLINCLQSRLKERKAPGLHSDLALLYYETGQLKKACFHAKAWLAHLSKSGPSSAEERARTRRQLKAMKCS